MVNQKRKKLQLTLMLSGVEFSRLTRQKWQDRLILQHRDYSFRIPAKEILISVNCRGLSKVRLTQVHIFRSTERDKIALVLNKQKIN